VIAAIQRRRRDRQNNGEGGFTLIELMVVVMIIAILLGIAIPAYLGAKSQVQDTAAKSNLRIALGAAQTRFSDQQVFEAVAAMVPGLENDEPSLTFLDSANGTDPGTGTAVQYSSTPKQVSVETVASTAGGLRDEIYLASYSSSGNCYYMRHQNASGANAGTYMGTVKTAATNCSAVYAETAGNVTFTAL